MKVTKLMLSTERTWTCVSSSMLACTETGSFQNNPDLGPFQNAVTCNEGDEVEYGENLDLGLLVHVGVHRDMPRTWVRFINADL